VTPYKATFDISAEVLREVRVWAVRHEITGVAPVVRALIEELADPATSARVEAALATGPQPDRGPVKKTTYDLDPPVYRDLKGWAAAHDTTGVAVVRVLLAALVDDPAGQLATRVATRAR
jgi:hypothetical protein